MPILAGILVFLQIAQIVFSLKDKVLNKDEKSNVSGFLNGIGDLLENVATDLETGVYPHSKCMQMFELLNGLNKDALKGKLPKEEIDKLHDLIEKSYQVEQLFGEYNSLTDEEKTMNLTVLKTAAGTFAATGKLIMVK